MKTRNSLVRAWVCIPIFLTLLAGSAMGAATSLYWDVNANGAGAGGPSATGTWDATTPNWNGNANGNPATVVWSPGNLAVFSAGTDASGVFTVTVAGLQSANGLTFEEGTVTLSGGELNLAANPVAVNSGAKAIISSVISGSAGLVKLSAGELVLEGANLFSGNLTNRGAILTLDNDQAASTGSIVIDNSVAAVLRSTKVLTTIPNEIQLRGTGATIEINAASGKELALTGRLTGPRSWTANGAGTLRLGGTATNDFPGTLTIAQGTVVVAKEGALGSAVNGTVVNAGATLALDGNLEYNVDESVTLNGAGVGGGAALKNLSGNNYFAGDVTLNADSVIGADAGALALLGSISGNYNITKVGPGIVDLGSGSNPYRDTLVSQGTLGIWWPSVSGSGPVTVSAGARLEGNGAAPGGVVVSGVISPGASPESFTSGAQVWNGGGAYQWEINDAAGMAGTPLGWDQLVITNSLTIAATEATPFVLDLIGLEPNFNTPEVPANFDPEMDYQWTIATASGGVIGFSPAKFQIVTSGSLESPNAVFLVELQNAGKDLVLRRVHRPFVVTQPLGSTNECGIDAKTFSVVAGGTEPLSYQWTKNGISISGATGTSLSMPGTVSLADSGDYAVTVSNQFGVVTSSVATLLVQDTIAPVLVCPPPTTVNADLDQCFATGVDLGDVNVTEVCGLALITNDAPAQIPVGTNLVTWTAVDASGNSNSCVQTVIVNDVQGPTVACANHAVTLSALGSYTLTPADVAALLASAVDPCGLASTNVTPNTFTVCDQGGVPVVVTVTDIHGNATACNAQITVQPPVGSPAVVYVDDDYGTDCAQVTFPATGGTGTNYIGYNAFKSMQAAVNAVGAGGAVYVAAGSYKANLVIGKSLSLLGPNAGRPGSSTRVAEAVITTAVADPENIGIVSIEADDVTIDGFLLDGYNPDLGTLSGYASGNPAARLHAAAGVQNGLYPNMVPVEGIRIQNNLIRNVSYDGVYIELPFGMPNGSNYILANKIENCWEAIQTYALHSAIVSNVVVSCNMGIGVHGVVTPAPAGFVPTIASNTLTIAQWWPAEISRFNAPGIWVNFRQDDAEPLDVVANVINTPVAPPSGKTIRGLFALTIKDGAKVNFIRNTVNGSGNCTVGAYVVACPDVGGVSIVDGELHSMARAGVLAATRDSVWGDGNALVRVSGTDIRIGTGGSGLWAFQDPATPTLQAEIAVSSDVDVISSGVNNAGVRIEGNLANVSITGAAPLQLTGLANYIVITNHIGNLDATAVNFDGVTGAALPVDSSVHYILEDKIVHKLDVNSLGFVRVKAQNVYVSALSGSIQRGVNAASPGDFVRVQAATYVENVIVDRPVKLLGPNAGVAGTASRGAEAIVRTAVVDPEGVAVVSVEADDTTVDGFLLDGFNPALGSGTGYASGTVGVRLHAAAGVQNGLYPIMVPIDRIRVQNNIIRNISYDGVYLELPFGMPNGDNYIVRNRLENMWEGIQTYAMHSVIASNTLTLCNMGLSVHGTVTEASAGFTPVIAGNTISIAQWWPAEFLRENASGIWVNYRRGDAAELSVTGNTINTPVTPPSGRTIRALFALTVDGEGRVNFIDNTVNGAGNCTVGAYVTSCTVPGSVQIVGGTLNNIAGTGVLATSRDLIWGDGRAYVTVSNVNIQMSSGAAAGVAAVGVGTLGAGVVVSGSGSISGADAAVRAVGNSDTFAVVRNQSGAIVGNVVGVDVNGGKALIENANLAGNLGAAIRAQNNALVDAGDCHDSNLTGLGAGSGAVNGSSLGLNNLTGYSFGGSGPYSVQNLNASQPVLAFNNAFGAAAGSSIPASFVQTSPVLYSQGGVLLVSCPPAMTVGCVNSIPAGATTLPQFLAQGGLVSCNPATVSFSDSTHPAGSGTVTRTYTLSNDCGGLAVACTQTITVIDTNPPVILCPPAIVQTTAPNLCTALVALNPPATATDDCGSVSLAPVRNDGQPLNAPYPKGTNLVTWTAADPSGNIAVCVQQVVILDQQAPSITPPAMLTLNTDANQCYATVVSLGLATVSDNCTVAGISNSASATLPKGTNIVVWTAFDTSGNASSANQTVVVRDIQKPVITCAPPVTVTVAQSRDYYATGVPTATDNCGAVTIVWQNDDRTALTNCNATGVIRRTWRATDASGNFVDCVQNVTVADPLSPQFTALPGDVTTIAEPGVCTAMVTYPAPVAWDLGFKDGFEDPGWDAGNHLVRPSVGWNDYYSRIDQVATGTDGIASATGTAHAVIDSSLPLLGPQTGAFCRLGGFSTVFGTGFRSSVDVYINLADAEVLAATPTQGYGFEVNAPVNSSAGGNRRDFLFQAAAYTSSNVVIGVSMAPVLDRRNDLQASNHYTVTSSGWYRLEWVYRNNSGVLAVDMNIRSTAGALIWSQTLSDASDVISLVGGNYYMWFSYLGTLKMPIDNTLLERSAAIATSQASGSAFSVGTNLVVCTASDACGNSTNYTFKVIVHDTQAPTLVCPPSINTATDPGQCFATVNYPITVSDNCGTYTVVAVPPSGSTFPIGTTPVNIVVTDAHGNMSSCGFNVTVSDQEAPLITCLPTVYRYIPVTNTSTAVTFPSPVAFDNCGSFTTTLNPGSGSVFPLGTNTVHVKAWDASNNTNTCSFNVVVRHLLARPSVAWVNYTPGNAVIGVTGQPNMPVVLQASSDLVNWTGIHTNFLPYTFTDTAPQPGRFYRAAFIPYP